jgi:uncharacterized membrane protein
MSAGDVFLLVVRWLHLIAAVAWVGGSLYYILVLRPALRRSPEAGRPIAAAAGAEFRGLVTASIVVLVATGAVLSFDRLTHPDVDAPYTVTLGIKAALSVWMFLQVQVQRRRSRVLEAFAQPKQVPQTGIARVRAAFSGYNAIVIVGILVLLLSDLLKVLFEAALARG